jgi:hypothetical protein
MKIKYLSMIALGLALSCNNAPEQVEDVVVEEVVTEEEIPTGAFGAEISEEGALSTSEMLALLEGQDSAKVKIAATINECCQKKGCWMDVDLGNGKTMVVKFKDYDFFVPKNSAGHTAIMEGIVKMETQDVAWLKHKAEDAGKSQEEIDAITEPEVSLSFLADGVIIK